MCEACIKLKYEKDGTCPCYTDCFLVVPLPQNELYLNLYYEVKSQVVMGFNGAVALRKDVVFNLLTEIGITDKCERRYIMGVLEKCFYWENEIINNRREELKQQQDEQRQMSAAANKGRRRR